jgi:uncharacterized damage-inducible protein DinB
MKYAFLVETYETERVRVLSVRSEFKDEDLPVRPREADPRGRSVHEQMVHQCVSEDLWFRNMLNIDVGAPPLPNQETRTEFLKRYAEDSGKRLAALRAKEDSWWEENTTFFEVQRTRAWVVTRRLLHTSHHRGQLMAMLRMLAAIKLAKSLAASVCPWKFTPQDLSSRPERSGVEGPCVFSVAFRRQSTTRWP